MVWCSLVGADRPPKQAMLVARQEDLGLCVLWSLSLSLQSVPIFWCFLVGADRPPKQEIMPVARQEDLGLCVLWSLSLSLQSVPRCKNWHCVFRRGRVDVLVFFGRSGPPA